MFVSAILSAVYLISCNDQTISLNLSVSASFIFNLRNIEYLEF
jgi:hypothetical protein